MVRRRNNRWYNVCRRLVNASLLQAAAVVMVSVMLPTMKELGEDSRFNRAILLGIAFAGNIGGMTVRNFIHEEVTSE